MVFTTPEHVSTSYSASPDQKKPFAFFVPITALKALCAKQASRVARKLKTKQSHKPSSTLARPKQLLKMISNTASSWVHWKKNGVGGGPKEEEEEEEVLEDVGVWQRTIMMGGKCQPLNFPGVIYYDRNGNQVNEVPIRSPRASPLPGYLTRTSAGK